MDIQIGDRITYKCIATGEISIVIVDRSAILEDLKYDKSFEILKIERPKYEVVEEKKETLDRREKEYLWNIIKPFKNQVSTIGKYFNTCHEKYYIGISIINSFDVILPYFKGNTMYKGMEKNKCYTLKELGLEVD